MDNKPACLVTGGTGYIGSHTVVELMATGRDVVIVDNLCNSKVSVLDRIERIAGRRPQFAELDIRDRRALREVMRSRRFEAVVHFAGLKAVGESVEQPLAYYDNNVSGTLALLECMSEAGVRTIVFSSSATVYGDPAAVPVHEDSPVSATNPYGRTKLVIEHILRDLAVSDPVWRVALLRYFNPVGAHSSGLIGEDPNGIPNNLMPYIAQVAVGKLKELPVFGSDYPTPDGTGVRDYLHVVDLARGHLAALHGLGQRTGVLTVNLGTGRGYSVLEMVEAFAAASGRPVPYRIMPRRRATLRSATRTPRARRSCWAGGRSWGLRLCAQTRGAGNSGRRKISKQGGDGKGRVLGPGTGRPRWRAPRVSVTPPGAHMIQRLTIVIRPPPV